MARSGAAEFAQFLAAAAAGRHQPIARAHDRRFDDPPSAGQDHRGDRAGLGAGALRIGGVLDIAAGMDAPMLVLHRRADQKARIGRVGLRAAPSTAAAMSDVIGASFLLHIGQRRRPWAA